MRITFVKKILSTGVPCRKCDDVLERMQQADQMKFIDSVIVADERDPQSPGMLLAAQYQVERAPFFIVERDNQPLEIFTVYLKFVKDVLEQQTSEQDTARDILDSNPDLDFL